MFFNHIAEKIINYQINFLSDIFYVRLVTTTPANTIVTASQLTEANGGNYTWQYIFNNSPRTFVNAGSEVLIRDFGYASWSALITATNTPLVGCVICRQATIPSSTDWCVFFLPFPNTPNSPNGRFTPDASDLLIEFKNNSGILKFKAQ